MKSIHILNIIMLCCIFSCSTAQEKTETMKNNILKDQYALHVRLFNNVVKDIKDEEADLRISENVNSFKWIAGHTLDIQYNLAMIFGLETENPYAENFAFGKTFNPEGDYPSLQKMASDWNDLAPRIEEAFNAISQDNLEAKSPFPLPIADQTIRGLLSFQMHHLAYEIGQLGIYRKFLGKESMSYQ